MEIFTVDILSIDLFTNDLLSPLMTMVLIVLAGFTSFLTSALGAGGGLLLLVVMASILPMSLVIPVHGIVQLGSNANRMLFTFKHVDKHLLGYFCFGALFGAIASTFIVTQVPLELMKFAVAGFVLYLLWGKMPTINETSTTWSVLVGVITTFLSMFIGASGPLVGSCLHVKDYGKLRFTATFSSCMTFQHTLKAFVFGAVGFSFWQWLPLTLAMIISGAFGTWLGLKVLNKIPAANFKVIFRVVLTLLSLQLAWQGIESNW